MRKSIRDAILAETNAAKGILDVAEKENRTLTDAEKDLIDGHMNKANDLSERAKKEEAFRTQMLDISGGLGEEPESLIDEVTREKAQGKRRKSMGEIFTSSPEFKALMATTPNGSFSEKQRVQSQTVHVGSMKSLIWSSDHDVSAGPMIEHDFRGLQDPFYQRPLTVRSLFATGQTTSDHIEYVKMINTDNNAAVVPEAQTTLPVDPVGPPIVTPAQAGVKPESGFEFERESTDVKNIANWMPITKRALADVAQIRTLIDNFLTYNLEEVLETEVMTGDGTGEHFLGLANTPGIQTQTGGAGEDAFDITRKARTKVRIGGRATPTAYVLNPLDWQDIDLMRTGGENVFFGSGPYGMTTPRLWGLPVVESEAVPPKTAYCAAWNWGVIWDRQQTAVTATDSHADFYIRNLVAILAEMRCAFGVIRPQAFVKITLP
jgi:HK97 family phage major capsid protein